MEKMKKSILMLIVVIVTITAKGQDYQFFDPIPLEFMQQQFDRRQAAYDANFQYAQELYNWCEELLAEDTDAKFRTAIINQKVKISRMKVEDLSILGNQLKAVESNISSAIRMYNRRYDQKQKAAQTTKTNTPKNPLAVLGEKYYIDTTLIWEESATDWKGGTFKGWLTMNKNHGVLTVHKGIPDTYKFNLRDVIKEKGSAPNGETKVTYTVNATDRYATTCKIVYSINVDSNMLTLEVHHKDSSEAYFMVKEEVYNRSQ